MGIIYEPRGRAKEYSKLAANLYTGCLHGCIYCYAPVFLRRNKEEFHQNPLVRKNLFKELTKDLRKMKSQDKKTDPVLLCFTCDPYQGDENFNMTTRRAIQGFKKFDVPFQVLTKAGHSAIRDFDLYGPNDAFATTLTFFDRNKSLLFEPGAALPANRISALQEAKKRGIKTWVSFEPILDEFEVYKLFDRTYDFVDFYKVGKCSGDFSSVENWKHFGNEIINKMEKKGVGYYVKKDLRICL